MRNVCGDVIARTSAFRMIPGCAFLATCFIPLGASRQSIAGAGQVPEIARAVADTLDPVNGLPTVMIDAFACPRDNDGCRSPLVDDRAGAADTLGMAASFAAARRIPLVSPEAFELPICPWHAGEGYAAKGLYAQFVRAPDLAGDSTQIDLASGCGGRRPFLQIHRFVLSRRNDVWIVVRRELLVIT